MLRIQVYAARAAEILPDRLMQKDMEATFERYAPPEGDQPQLTGEQVAALLDGVKTHVEAFCSGFPMPFGDEGGKAGASSRGWSRRAAAQESSGEEEESDEEFAAAAAAAAARRMPARATRAVKTLAESSEEEGPAPARPAAPVAAPAIAADSSDEEESESEEESDGEEEEEEEGAENAARPSASKTRRQSTESVAALREALRENARIS